MKATDALTLPPEVLLERVDTLEPSITARLSHGPDDYLVSRPRARARSLVVDADAARLLAQFRSPKTVVDAVIDLSSQTGADPERLLEDALPLIAHLQHLRLLVIASSPEASSIEPTLVSGALIRDYRINSCVHIFEDV